MFDTLRELWRQTPVPIKTFAIAAAGALFGAWLSSRAQTKRAIVAELRALRAAHALCFSIANKAITLKRQHVKSIKDAYDALSAEQESFMQNPIGQFGVQLELQTLSPVSFPAAALEKMLFEKTSIGGEGVATAVQVTSSVDDLRYTIDQRKDLIAEFQNDQVRNDEEQIYAYLGLVRNNHVDDRFRNNVDALYSQTDDCIFFAQRLGTLIIQYENKLRRRYRIFFWLPDSKLEEPDWRKADGYLPPLENYSDWTSGFLRRQSRLQKAKNFLVNLFTHRS